MHVHKCSIRAMIAAAMMVPLAARADFSGRDSLAVNTGNWEGYTVAGDCAMVFQNSRLEFLASNAGNENTILAKWLPNTGSPKKAWFVEVETHVDLLTLPEGNFIDAGLDVESSAPNTGSCYHSMSRLRDADGHRSGFVLYNEQGVAGAFDSGLTDARMRIHYDPSSGNLVSSVKYGAFWIYSSPINVSSWGMGAYDTFRVYLMARSQGSPFAIGTGTAYFRNFRAGAASPSITVEQPALNFLKDGKNTMTYGKVRAGRTVTKTVLIRSQGTKPLQNLALKVDGLNAKDFRVVSYLTTDVLMPGAWVKVKVAFRPKIKGLRSAKLHVLSNDPVQSSFDIALSGRGT